MTVESSSISPDVLAHFPTTSEQERSWELHVFHAWQTRFSTIAEIYEFLSHPVKVLQHNSRGIVLLVHHDNTLFIAKRSLGQERRFWTQFTSIYRGGEGTRTLQNMHKLYELGLPVPEPVCVLEKKRWGFTVASWGIYRYLEGETCSFSHSDRIARTLRKMHEKGWVHRDPHVWNFLVYHDEIRILDCARARPWRSKYARMYDVVLLDKCSPGSARQYGISETYWVYRLTKFQNKIVQLWRCVKKKLRFWRA